MAHNSKRFGTVGITIVLLAAVVAGWTIVHAKLAAQSQIASEANYMPVVANPPLPTATPGSVFDNGDLADLREIYVAYSLPAGWAHSYSLRTYLDETWQVQALSTADLVISVWRDQTLLVDRQNEAPAGEIESIGPKLLAEPGQYIIQVADADWSAVSEYAIVASQQSEMVTFKGFIKPGQTTGQATTSADETHIWFTIGNPKDRLQLHLATDMVSDGLIDIYGPGAEYLDTVDDGFEGEDEVYLLDVTNSGMHGFAITEIDFAPMTYTFELSLINE